MVDELSTVVEPDDIELVDEVEADNVELVEETEAEDDELVKEVEAEDDELVDEVEVELVIAAVEDDDETAGPMILRFQTLEFDWYAIKLLFR